MEKERQNQGEGVNPQNLEHDVAIHTTHLGKFSLPPGATLADLIEEIKKERKDLDLSGFTVMLNDRNIELTPDGKLKENPALTENSALTLLKKFVGGTLS